LHRTLHALLICCCCFVLRAPVVAANPQPPTLSACIAASISAAQPAAPGDSATLLPVASLGGAIETVAASADGRLIVFGEGAALAIAQPDGSGVLTRLARIALPDRVQDLAFLGSLVYVTTGSGGLQVVDLANPAAPTLRRSLDLPGLPNGLFLAGSQAYVASAGLDGGLLILDTSNPATPTLLSRTSVFGSATGITIANGKAYVAAGYGGGLQIFDLPTNGPPVARSSLITPGPALAVVATSERAYLAAGFCGVQTIDITNPDLPVLLGEVESGDAARLTLAGTTLYVAAGSAGMRVFNLNNGSLTGSAGITPAGSVSDLELAANGQLYLTTGVSGIQSYTIVQAPVVGDPPTSYLLAGSLPGLAPEAIMSSNNTPGYLLGGDKQLARIATSDPTAPVLSASSTITATIRDLARNGTLVVAAGGSSGLLVFEENGPAIGLNLQATLPITGSAAAIALTGNTAYTALGSGGIAAIDLSNQQRPVVQAYRDTPGQALSVAISGTLVLVADGSSLRAYEAPNLRPTAVLTATGGASYRSVVIYGNLAYAGGSGGLAVVDVSDPTQLRLRETVGTSSGGSMIIGPEERLFVAGGIAGVNVFDLSTPEQPELIARRNTPGNALDLAITGDHLFVADAGGGVQVFRIVELPFRVVLPMVTR
jgi:hypothetical protein